MGKRTPAPEYYHRYHPLYAHAAWELSEKSIANALLWLARGLNHECEPEAVDLLKKYYPKLTTGEALIIPSIRESV